MQQVIPKPHQSRVLRDLTAQPIEFYMKEVEVFINETLNYTLFHTSFQTSSCILSFPILHSVIPPFQMLHQHVVKSLSHHDFPVAISVFRLIRHVQGLLPEYRTVLHVGVACMWAWFHL